MNEETSLEKDGVNITHLYFVACTETQKYIKSIQALNFFTIKTLQRRSCDENSITINLLNINSFFCRIGDIHTRSFCYAIYISSDPLWYFSL